MSPEEDAYNSLCAYTLLLGDAAFIHQHVVDAYAAQSADAQSKPIRVAFALVGLYLLVEKQFSGRQVQRAHMQLGQHKRDWPSFVLPAARGSMTAVDVMAEREGPGRDDAINAWCVSVWAAYSENRETVDALLRQRGII